MIWEKNFQLVEFRVEDFLLVGDFLQEAFVLNRLPFLKWEINYQMVHKNSQLMLLVELSRKRKGPRHIQSYFHSYFWHLNDLL